MNQTNLGKSDLFVQIKNHFKLAKSAVVNVDFSDKIKQLVSFAEKIFFIVYKFVRQWLLKTDFLQNWQKMKAGKKDFMKTKKKEEEEAVNVPKMKTCTKTKNRKKWETKKMKLKFNLIAPKFLCIQIYLYVKVKI